MWKCDELRLVLFSVRRRIKCYQVLTKKLTPRLLRPGPPQPAAIAAVGAKLIVRLFCSAGGPILVPSADTASRGFDSRRVIPLRATFFVRSLVCVCVDMCVCVCVCLSEAFVIGLLCTCFCVLCVRHLVYINCFCVFLHVLCMCVLCVFV